MSQEIANTERADEIIEVAIEQSLFEIAKCDYVQEVSWHFEHDKQHWILERIQFFISNDNWMEMQGF